MLKKVVILASLLVLVLTVAACGNGDGDNGDSADTSNTTPAQLTDVTLNEDYADALPVSSQ